MGGATCYHAPINGADFAAQFARTILVNILWKANHKVLSAQVVDHLAGTELQEERIYKKGLMKETKPIYECGHGGTIHDHVRYISCEALKEQQY